MSHAFYAPSSAHRWINCPGSMGFEENQVSGDSSTHADNGTASHEWAAYCLKNNTDAESLLGAKLVLNGTEYVMDEERAGYVQQYLDWVRSLIPVKWRFVEHKVDMRPLIETNGTTDVGGYNEDTDEMLVLDLKYGVGEWVSAKYNAQGLCYAVGFLQDLALLGIIPKGFRLGIGQPRLDNFDVWPPLDEPPMPLQFLDDFVTDALEAISRAEDAIVNGPAKTMLNPAEKTCRWCRAKARCPALAEKVQTEVGAMFDDLTTTGAPTPPHGAEDLAKAYAALPIIGVWMKAIIVAVTGRVKGGEIIPGTDGQPLKFVEGKKGDRKWKDNSVAEAALLGQLPPEKVYKPREIITAAAAAKIFDKKKTAAIWEVLSENISRADGKPKLVLGSDPRPPFTGSVADADDFEIQEE